MTPNDTKINDETKINDTKINDTKINDTKICIFDSKSIVIKSEIANKIHHSTNVLYQKNKNVNSSIFHHGKKSPFLLKQPVYLILNIILK